jgi:outer membrane protein
MRELARPLAAALLAICGAAARADDLLDVYRLARATDPVLAAAGATRAVSHDLTDQARGALLPQGAAAAAVARERESGAALPTASGRTSDATLAVTQVVFDAGLFSTLKQQQSLASAQDAAWRAAEEDLCLRVATAYFDALLAADTLADAQANEDAYAQQVAQSRERFAAGLAAQVDVDESRAYEALAHATTIAARQAHVDALDAIAEITGVAPGPLKPLRDDLPLLPPEPADAQAWVDAALHGNPTLWQAEHGVAAAEQGIAAARAGHLPTLSAGLGLGRPTSTVAGTDPGGRLTTTVGLTLTVPLFAGGATQARVRQAVHERESAQDTLESQRRAVARAARAAFGQVGAGIGQVQAARASVVAARTALDEMRVGREVGNRTMSDLLIAIQNLASAQDAHALARHQFILGRLQLQRAAGALGEADLAAVNALLE